MGVKGVDPSVDINEILPVRSEAEWLVKPEPVFMSNESSRCNSPWSETHIPSGTYSEYAESTSKLPLHQSKTNPARPTRVLTTMQETRRRISNYIHPKTFLNLVDIREFFWPITWKRYLTLLLVTGFVVGIVISNSYCHWINKAMQITRRNMLPVLIIVIGLEPIMITIILLVARVPTLPTPAPSASSQDVEHDVEKALDNDESEVDHRTAFVIPCHNSDHEALEKVIQSALPHFRPKDIFVVDNGRSRYPSSPKFRQFVRGLSPEINYIWSPIGSKNAAQLVGAMAAKEYQYIMTVDDDVSIPATFSPPIDKLDDVTKACAFPLKAIDAKGKTPLFLVAWQDCEYKMSGLTKLAESSICGVLYPHGACWFCERETLIDLISNYHSIDFIAEDVNTGISMQKMKKRIAFDATCILETEVPTTVFGSGLNWWNQRYRSWEMGRHGRLLAFAARLLLSLNGQKTPWGILFQKFIHLYSIATIIVDWVRVPVFVTMGTSPRFWIVGCSLMCFSAIPILIFKFVSARRRPDLQPRFLAAVTYPLYVQLYAFVSVFGAMRSVLFYVGGHNRPKTIKKMISDNDPNALWLDPRFESNPAFLADEAEGLVEKGCSVSDEKHLGSINVTSEEPFAHSIVSTKE